MRFARVLLICSLAFATSHSQVPRQNLNVPSTTRARTEPADPCFRQVMENKQVRVYRVEVAARESTGLNSHRHDYVVLSLGKSDFEVSGSGNSFPVQLEDGEMQVLKGGWPHRVINHADTPLRLIELEVLTGIHPEQPVCGLGGRPCRDGKFATNQLGSFTQSTLFETDTVKLARLDLAAGSVSAQHHHPTSHLLLALDDSHLKDESDLTKDLNLKPGELAWYDPNVMHSLRNLASRNVRLITLEFK